MVHLLKRRWHQDAHRHSVQEAGPNAPRCFFLKLVSLIISGMIEPWPECQPEESRPREARPEDSSIYIWFTKNSPVSVENPNVYFLWNSVFVSMSFTCITEAQQKHNGRKHVTRYGAPLSTELVLVKGPPLQVSCCRQCHILILSPGTQEQDLGYAISLDSQDVSNGTLGFI